MKTDEYIGTTGEPKTATSAFASGESLNKLARHLRNRAPTVIDAHAEASALMFVAADVIEGFVKLREPLSDDDEAPPARTPKAKKTTPPANACTDGKRHKYGEDRKCSKCGAADPRAKAQPADGRQVEVPGAGAA